MAFVIGQPCVDVKDRACVDECPLDCIYEGARSLYIHPDECMECGACEAVCPVGAVSYVEDVAAAPDNGLFFSEILPGREVPLGSPGGAAKVGLLDVDTVQVATLPPQRPPARRLPRENHRDGGCGCDSPDAAGDRRGPS
jgi:ferredoxin